MAQFENIEEIEKRLWNAADNLRGLQGELVECLSLSGHFKPANESILEKQIR